MDKVLAQHQLQRRIVLTTHLLTLSTIIAASDIVADVTSRIAHQFAAQGAIAVFDLPLELQPWSVSMIWSKLSDQDQACRWLRTTIQAICQNL